MNRSLDMPIDHALRFMRRLLIWTAICGIAALPSFLIAADFFNHPMQIAAMLLGIGCFILAYTVATGLPWFTQRWKMQATRTTMYIVYGTRMGISLVLPVGMMMDIIVGIFTTAVLERVAGGADLEAPRWIFARTLMQGAALNLILLVYGVIVHAIVNAVTYPPPPKPTGLCEQCGYDLRATPDRCPECGTVPLKVPPTVTAAVYDAPT